MALQIRGVAPLLFVYDMPTSVRFYRDLLGCDIVTTSPTLGEDYFHWALLRLGDAELMLNTAFESNDDRPPRLDRPPAHHRDIWLYFGCPDVDAAYKELLDRGVQAEEPVVTYYGMKQMRLHDPDGYKLCFQWPAQG